jgi:hypothetical protein
MSRQLLQQSLDALDTCDAHLEVSGMNYGYYFNQEAVHNAVKALATALAQPEPSPVAWMDDSGRVESAVVKIWASSQMAASYNIPLYTAPQAPTGDKS